MDKVIIGEYKPIKRGQWKDLSIPIYKPATKPTKKQKAIYA